MRYLTLLVATVLLAHTTLALNAAISEHDDGKPAVEPFVPTDEFQVIKDGQDIPPGLYVKLDVSTGQRMAKKMPKNEQASSTASHDLIVPEDTKHEMDAQEIAKEKLEDKLHRLDNKQAKHTAPSSRRKPLSRYHQSTDDQRIAHYLVTIKAATVDNKEKHAKLSEALDDLQDLVDDLETGYNFAHGDGIPQAFRLLDPSWPRDIRRKAAIIIGEALSNNPEAQQAARPHHVTTRLLALLGKEHDNEIISRLLYALSSATRGDRIAHDAFYNADGFLLLVNAYERASELHVRSKALDLFIDLLNPDMQSDEAASTTPSHRGLGDWCEALGRTLDLSTSDIYFQLDFVRALVALKEEEARNNNEVLCPTNATITRYIEGQIKAQQSSDENEQELLKLLQRAQHLYKK
ncbi:hypothetical protein SYNPS1DRAFT_31862 [Syncephalis pseudoplumigaleata]|uniref:Nucleotide exchange factor SIL1 n=1 Tax=Syncephalis pseudoplumigaleata TaxID=1712513 RepID=A0A4P9YS08_9FUNG|nr:hypothetical protein SYNPS1DRAFT_31862 [Syncephalis pseudoplumigaleata]|eukprot:RKP22534.1 hypothetical protein SYNPS1DRAFT_31862 [Syncephalis pseudoplumigaleata]